MKMGKQPILVLKKKFTEKHLLYKVEWSNGSISYEPLNTMEPEMLNLIEQWEVQQHFGGRESTKRDKQNQKESEKRQHIVDRAIELKDNEDDFDKWRYEIKPKTPAQQKKLNNNNHEQSRGRSDSRMSLEELEEPAERTKGRQRKLDRQKRFKEREAELANERERAELANHIAAEAEKERLQLEKEQARKEQEKTEKARIAAEKARAEKVRLAAEKIRIAAETVRAAEKARVEKARAEKPEKNEKARPKPVEHVGHQPKPSVACTIQQVRKAENDSQQLEFQVSYEEGPLVWVIQNELQKKAPRALCDYLLGKVSFGGKR